MLSIFICKIICEVLADRQHEGWERVFEYFFDYLCENGINANFEKCVADAVSDVVCEYLPDDIVLDKDSIDLLYALYAEYADTFEERVREHILRKVYQSDLCEVG